VATLTPSFTPTVVWLVVNAAALRAAPLTVSELISGLKSQSQYYRLKTAFCITTSSVIVEYDEDSAPTTIGY